jgi:hypothetical protein
MTYYIMSDGSIKQATDVLAKELIKRGARELKLTPIEINYETRGSNGAIEVPKLGGGNRPRSGKRKVPRKLDKAGGGKQ